MDKQKELLLKILTGTSDKNIAFNDLIRLLINLGFQRRTKGSHNIFTKHGIVEQINLQRDGSKAKAYQVKQIRAIILKYKL